ncbi:MAG: hypothetical protein ABI779_04320 [Acidobacteriota bacterium]
MKTKSLATALMVLLPMLFVSANASPASANAPTNVIVAFEGLIVHVLGGGITRAIVPRMPGHQMTITLPPSAKTDVERIFAPLKCPTVCDVPIDGLAFRIADAQGQPVTAPFTANNDFQSIVTHLSEVPSPDQPFATTDDLIPEIFADHPYTDSLIAGYFELAGGTASTEAFGCGARFDGNSGYVAFPSKVNVLYTVPNGAMLQVLKAGSDQWEDIVLNGRMVTIGVKNDLPDSNMSHFDMYAVLSKKRVNGGFVDLPEIHTDGRRCISPAGGLPGCSQSQWP